MFYVTVEDAAGTRFERVFIATTIADAARDALAACAGRFSVVSIETAGANLRRKLDKIWAGNGRGE